MRMNKHLLRISICLWLCLFTFISTWGDEVSFNPVTTTSENDYFKLTNNDMVNVTSDDVVTGIKGASPKNFTSSSKKGELISKTCPQGFVIRAEGMCGFAIRHRQGLYRLIL